MVRTKTVPTHIALIPDGNRRWARSRSLALLAGYSKGVQKIVDVSLWAKAFGVKTMTIWVLSTDNIKNRSKAELGVLYRLYTRTAKDPKILKLLDDNKVMIKIIGNRSALPLALRTAFNNLEQRTRHYTTFTINLLMGYGGREDLLNAFKSVYRMGAESKSIDIDEALVKSSMESAAIADPDLIIRTSGEERLSGLLPWQSTYAELYFEKKSWPDFERRDLQKAIATFSRRKRRFGK